jgi:tetrahydromethanopterin S-methyltransferase subunit C
MGSHPINLTVRFLLELAACIALGFWGWQQSEALPIQIGLALGLPLIAATLWGTLAVPDDPSRSGAAPVPIPGWLRLGLELVFFALATWTLYDMGAILLSWIMGLVTLTHYIVSYDRLGWLVRQ